MASILIIKPEPFLSEVFLNTVEAVSVQCWAEQGQNLNETVYIYNISIILFIGIIELSIPFHEKKSQIWKFFIVTNKLQAIDLYRFYILKGTAAINTYNIYTTFYKKWLYVTVFKIDRFS